MTAGRAVGIDLGTTNSVVAVIDRDGAPRILTTEEGSTTLPSLVWFSPLGPVVGEAARAGLDHSPDRTIFGSKRLLGRRFDHPDVRKLARVLPYELTEAPNGDTWIQLAAGRAISPEEVSALILRELKRTAERFLDEPVTRAVLASPWASIERARCSNASLPCDDGGGGGAATGCGVGGRSNRRGATLGAGVVSWLWMSSKPTSQPGGGATIEPALMPAPSLASATRRRSYARFDRIVSSSARCVIAGALRRITRSG